MKMMKGKEKVQQICDLIKKDTLEPAQEQAKKILEHAHEEARRLIRETEHRCHEKEEHSKKEIAQQRRVFLSSLGQASKQAIEALRQEIEHKVLSQGLSLLIDKSTADPKLLAKLIDAIVEGIKKEGLGVDLSAVVAKSVSASAVTEALMEQTKKSLQGGHVDLGDLGGGVAINIRDKQMTIDLSDKALKDLLMRYVRKDFRQHFFHEEQK